VFPCARRQGVCLGCQGAHPARAAAGPDLSGPALPVLPARGRPAALEDPAPSGYVRPAQMERGGAGLSRINLILLKSVAQFVWPCSAGWRPRCPPARKLHPGPPPPPCPPRRAIKFR